MRFVDLKTGAEESFPLKPNMTYIITRNAMDSFIIERYDSRTGEQNGPGLLISAFWKDNPPGIAGLLKAYDPSSQVN
ncbi:MAG: hypothetical protein GXP63_03515 [DPANN group archaeon]|nr:hypothetical protein [DPANN group archaeon]